MTRYRFATGSRNAYSYRSCHQYIPKQKARPSNSTAAAPNTRLFFNCRSLLLILGRWQRCGNRTTVEDTAARLGERSGVTPEARLCRFVVASLEDAIAEARRRATRRWRVQLFRQARGRRRASSTPLRLECRSQRPTPPTGLAS